MPSTPKHTQTDPTCSDCTGLDRRTFMQGAAGVVAAGAAPLGLASTALAGKKKATSETLVTQLYHSLTERQKRSICFPFDHELRSAVNNNWHIVKESIANVFDKDQQDLVRQAFLAMHSPEYAHDVMRQVESDAGKAGFGATAVALFGKPGEGKFEFVATGRHLTRRCDGDSVEGAAFGGPIFYGHAPTEFDESPRHEKNIYWYQAQRANALFDALDGKQRKMALINDKGRKEEKNATVKLKRDGKGILGMPMAELAADQKSLAKHVLRDLLAPFRKEDAVESMKLIEAGGGIDSLKMAYFAKQDIGDDKVWDVWQIEGPNMVWYYRGDPHVHVWAHIRAPQA